jgi:TonB-linked SusC/RagA family outer membrane protein
MTKFYWSFSRYLTVFFVLVASVAWSQPRTVTGRVISQADGMGIPGVNVVEKGTNNGAVTDVDGNYSINVSEGATLVFSFVGYEGQEIEVGNQSTINVTLALDLTALEEVVVVGYGTQEKKEITSAVASVKAEDFNKGTVTDPVQLLQGKVAGLNITRPGGDPNAGFNIRLRGVSTFGANQEPLVVIDGVIGGSLSTVDPNDIASMDVLKDASAAAIYGSRGGSGVILVTTKSGKAGRLTIDYNGSYAVENVARTIDVMSAEEYRQLPGAVDLGSSTDWLNLVTRTGSTQVHNFSLGGGTESTTYRASLNFRDAEGVGLNSGFEQINGRLNLMQRALNDRARFNVNLSTTSRDSEEGFDESFNYAILANPTMPVYDNTTTSPTAGGQFGNYAERDIFDFFNPLSIAEQNIRDREDLDLLASIQGEYDFADIVPGFRVALFYSQQRENEFRGSYNPKTAKFGRPGLGRASRRTDKNFNELFETTLNYTKYFGDVNVALLGGYSYQYFFNEGFGLSGGDFLTDAFTYNRIQAAVDFENGLGDVFSYANSNKLVAFFGRANFNFNETYFLSASARYEGSSRFGAENKWGLFPALSAGANLSNLLDIPAVNSLKLRVSYGVAGQQPGSSYISLLRYEPRGNFYFNGEYIPTYSPASNPNPNLQWETKEEINFGADFSMLDSRLSGSLDYYVRNTRDLILPVNVPVPPNFFPQTTLNIGEVQNSGFEIAANYLAVTGTDFTWTTGFNLSTYSTEVVSLTSGDVSVGDEGVLFQANMGSPGQNDTRVVRVKEGEPLGQFWGPIKIGVNEDGTPKLAVLNGSKVDKNGNPVYCDCDDDRTVIGNGMPTMTMGFNNTFTYKNFDLNIFLRGAFGHEMLNSYRGFYENNEPTTIASWNVVTTKYYDASLTKAQFNSSHIEKADFVRLDNATLGYNFNMNEGAVTRFRIFVSGQNLFTITGYTGIDPEVRFVDVGPEPDNPLAPGIERRSTYFTTRILTFGVNLGF